MGQKRKRWIGQLYLRLASWAVFTVRNGLDHPCPFRADIVAKVENRRTPKISLLYKMRCAARRLVLVSDLVRSRAGYALAAAVPRLLTRSRVVHVDAVRSVEAAFTPEEFRLLAAEAGRLTSV